MLAMAAVTVPYRKHPLLQFVDVDLARHTLHQDVPDITQDGFGCQQHQDGEEEGADGVSQLPPWVTL